MGRDHSKPRLPTCPLCKLRKASRRELVEHVMLECAPQETKCVCSRCGVIYRKTRRARLHNDGHECYKGNYNFRVQFVGYTLPAVKSLLASQGVVPTMVDEVAVKLQWNDPNGKDYYVSPGVERLRGKKRPPVATVRDALLGESAELDPPVAVPPKKLAVEGKLDLPQDVLDWPDNATVALTPDSDVLAVLGPETVSSPEVWAPINTPKPIYEPVDECSPDPPEGATQPIVIEDDQSVTVTKSVVCLPPVMDLNNNPTPVSLPVTVPVSPVKSNFAQQHWYPGGWYNRCTTQTEKLGIVVPLVRTDYFKGPSGEPMMRFPAVLRSSGHLVYVLAPTTNSCPEAVLRDCPQLAPYQPTLPEDLPWADQSVEGVKCEISGVLLQNGQAGLRNCQF